MKVIRKKKKESAFENLKRVPFEVLKKLDILSAVNLCDYISEQQDSRNFLRLPFS